MNIVAYLCRLCCIINHTTPTNKTPWIPNNTRARINATDTIGSTTFWPKFQRGNPAEINRLFSWSNMDPPPCSWGGFWLWVHCCCDCLGCCSCLLPRFRNSWARGSLSWTISPLIIVTIFNFLVDLGRIEHLTKTVNCVEIQNGDGIGKDWIDFMEWLHVWVHEDSPAFTRHVIGDQPRSQGLSKMRDPGNEVDRWHHWN